MVRGQHVSVSAQVRVGRRQASGVVVCRVRRRSFGVVDQRPLQLIGNHAEIVAAHVHQRIHAGLNAHRVRRGNELTISNKPQLVGVRNKPLRIGGGNVVAQQDNSRPEPGSVTQLPAAVFKIQFDAVGALIEFAEPLRLLGQQAPIVGGAHRVNRIEMRPRIGGEIDKTVFVVAAGHHSGDAQVETGIGLALGVYAGIAVHQARDDEFSRAIDNSGPFGNGNRSRSADLADAAVADDDHGIL